MSSDVIQSYRDFQIQFTDAAGRHFVLTAAKESKQIADVVTAECRAAILEIKPEWAFADDVEIYAVANGFHSKIASIAAEFTLRVSSAALQLRRLTEDAEQIADPAKFLKTQIGKGLAGKLNGQMVVQSVVACIPARN